MKYYILTCLAFICLLAVILDLQGADPTEVTATQYCDIYFSESDNKHVLVIDQTGHYVRKARSITINMVIGETEPTVKIESWDGPYRPSNTEHVSKANYKVRKVTSINTTEFNNIVNTGNKIKTGVEKAITAEDDKENEDKVEAAPIPTNTKPAAKPVTKP